MHIHKSILITWIFLSMMVVAYGAESFASENKGAYTQQVANATINWFDYTISATGKGNLPQMEIKWDIAEKVATRKALIHSRYDILQAIKKVRIHKDLFVRKRFRNHEGLAEHILGEIQNSRLTNKEIKNNDIIQVVSAINIDGELAKQIIPPGIWYSQGDTSAESDEKDTKAGNKEKGSKYTGVIVDARNISAEPALIFRLTDQEGKTIYGPNIVDRHVAYRQGMAVYVQNKTKAQESGRVGSNPLIIRAIDVVENAACDLVLPSGKAADLRKINKRTELLNKARVAIVLASKDNEGLVEYSID